MRRWVEFHRAALQVSGRIFRSQEGPNLDFSTNTRSKEPSPRPLERARGPPESGAPGQHFVAISARVDNQVWPAAVHMRVSNVGQPNASRLSL